MAGTPQPAPNPSDKPLTTADVDWSNNLTDEFKYYQTFFGLLKRSVKYITGTPRQEGTAITLGAIVDFATIQLIKIEKAGSLLKPSAKYEHIIVILNAIANSFKAAAQILGIEAIENNHLTRRRVAELLDIHENTVARWLKEPQYITDRLIIDGLNDAVLNLVAHMSRRTRDQINIMRKDPAVWHGLMVELYGDNVKPVGEGQDPGGPGAF